MDWKENGVKVVPGDSLRRELARRFTAAEGKRVSGLQKKHGVTPV